MQSTQRFGPILKWAGGKSRLLKQYDPYIPKNFKRYYEPFLGGGAMFFHLFCKGRFNRFQYLSDSNDELINFYLVLRRDPEVLIALLEKHKEQHTKYGGAYYQKVRSQKPKGSVGRAARFFYLNRTCFNGLFRTNRKGEFNVPMGRYVNPNIAPREKLLEVSEILRRSMAYISCQNFRMIEERAREKDFVYFDPPYAPTKAGGFVGYTSDGFIESDQTDLAKMFTDLVSRGVYCLLSNSDSPFTRELYKDHKIVDVFAPRRINSNSQERGNVREMLVVGS